MAKRELTWKAGGTNALVLAEYSDLAAAMVTKARLLQFVTTSWPSYSDMPNRYEPASPRQACNLVLSHKTILGALEIMSGKGPIYPHGADVDASALVVGPPRGAFVSSLIN